MTIECVRGREWEKVDFLTNILIAAITDDRKCV